MNKDKFLQISLRQRIFFIKQLAMLLRAGIPLLQALYILKNQKSSKTMRHVLRQISKDVESGDSLATAMGKFKKLFGQLTLHIIAVGEISGTLTQNLDHLALTLKKSQSLRHKVVSASVYPAFVVIATLGVSLIMVVFIFPKIVPVFSSIHYQLPWTTRLLICINTTLKNHYLFILAVIFLVVFGFWGLLKHTPFRFWYEKMLLRIPFVNTLIKTYNTANCMRTLGLLMGSGLPIVQAFHVTSSTTQNGVYKRQLDQASEQIAKGESVSGSLRSDFSVFPSLVLDMILVGESTGNLSETFLYLADVYETHMDEITKNISTSVEPILLLVMGLLVGFVTIAIITPIYGITQNIK